MSQPTLPFAIAPMTVADISAVRAVEEAAYPHPASRNYPYELEQNSLAHYFVLRVVPQKKIIGVSGLWLIADEAHVITLAIQPRWQGLGLGEWLLLNLLEAGQLLNGTIATLEVRPSNPAAISLYQKYRFQQVGRRARYYGNGEDALIFTTPRLNSPAYQAMLTYRKKRLLARLAKIEIDKLDQMN